LSYPNASRRKRRAFPVLLVATSSRGEPLHGFQFIEFKDMRPWIFFPAG
jgi:hypothetical protein